MYAGLGQILPAPYQGPLPNIAGRVLSYTTLIPGKIERPSNLSITQNGPFFTILNPRWDVLSLDGIFTSADTILLTAAPEGFSTSGKILIGSPNIQWDNGTVYTMDHVLTAGSAPPAQGPGAQLFSWPAIIGLGGGLVVVLIVGPMVIGRRKRR